MPMRLLRDPLAHFILAGGILFAAYSWFGPETPASDPEHLIVIDQAELDHLKTLWKAQWRRDPSPSDVAAIIDRHLRQEVFYREALKLNLDHNDGIVRKRLAQKMEAVANDLSSLMRPPTEERLRAYFHSREDFFTLPQAYAFKQVLFLPDEAGDVAELEATLASLREGGEVPRERRNKLSLPLEWDLAPAQRIENAFGGGFSEALSELPVGEWAGPVRSGYGWHLVLVEKNEPPRLPDFEEVRDFVARQYEYYSVLEAQDRVFEELRAKYQVRITAEDLPEDVRAEFSGS